MSEPDNPLEKPAETPEEKPAEKPPPRAGEGPRDVLMELSFVPDWARVPSHLNPYENARGEERSRERGADRGRRGREGRGDRRQGGGAGRGDRRPRGRDGRDGQGGRGGPGSSLPCSDFTP